MRVNDAIVGAVLVIFAVLEITYTRTFSSLHGQAYGPDLFPVLIGGGMIACGVVLIYRGLLHRRNSLQPAAWIDFGSWSSDRNIVINLGLVLLFLLAYIFFSNFVGFVIMSFLTISVLAYRFGSTLFVAIVCAVFATAVIQLLFAKVLLVPLPAGLLKGLIW